MKLFWCVFLFSLMVGITLGAESPRVYPTPQKAEFNGHVQLKKGRATFKVATDVDFYAVDVLKKLFDGYKVRVEVKLDENPSGRDGFQLPSAPEAYRLDIGQKKVVVTGRDPAGLFYAAQTLSQLLQAMDGYATLPSGWVVDWPDVPFRGTVEGFYGKPWSHDDRLRQIDFYGRYKMNTYIYGPKDDPYHGFSDQWREPYPEPMAQQIKELVDVSRQNHVNFVWAVHPGRDIYWVDADEDGIIDDFVACLEKFELMYALGVRSYAVFFDDISGEGTNAEMQVRMLNFLNTQFVHQKPDVTPLIMCPTQYNKAWSGGDYLDILGAGLDEDIKVMWTGDRVCDDIHREGMDWINKRIKRKAFIWWNWPVSDYVRTRLLIGRTYGLDIENKGSMSGFVSNPMDKPEASKIGLFGVADYTWNMHGLDSHQSWLDGIAILFPTLASEMQLFARHNSDQGPNGHRYRREESFHILPYIHEALEYFHDGRQIPQEISEKLTAEFLAMAAAGQRLAAQLPELNPALYEEIKCWVYSFEELGNAGATLMRMLSLPKDAKDHLFSGMNQVVESLNRKTEYSRQHQLSGAPDRWARGCETGGSFMTPFVKELFSDFSGNTIRLMRGEQAGRSDTEQSFYLSLTNVPMLENMPVTREGKYVNIQPMLEVLPLKSGEYVGLQLPPGVFANHVHVKLSNSEIARYGRLELSPDGEKWEEHTASVNGEEMQGPVDLARRIRFVRYINVSSQPVDIRLDMFKADVPDDAEIVSEAMLFDGQVLSGYTYDQAAEPYFIANTEKPEAARVYVVGDTASLSVVYEDGSTAPYSGHNNRHSQNVVGLSLDASRHSVRIFEIVWQ